MLTPCPPGTVRAVSRPIRHAFRHIKRHGAIHATIAISAGCVAIPAALLALLPPMTAPPAAAPKPTPTQVPEPSSLLLLVLPVALVCWLKARQDTQAKNDADPAHSHAPGEKAALVCRCG